jgi:hypothetical protein
MTKISEAQITACALMIKNICAVVQPQDQLKKIEERIRFMLGQRVNTGETFETWLKAEYGLSLKDCKTASFSVDGLRAAFEVWHDGQQPSADTQDERGALLPCPFCGSDAEHIHMYAYEEVVRCTNECCLVRPEVHCEMPEECFESWNTRAASTSANVAPAATVQTDRALTDEQRDAINTALSLIGLSGDPRVRNVHKTLRALLTATQPASGGKSCSNL